MKKNGNVRYEIAALIVLITFLALLFTNADIGVTWDEPAYIQASNSYTKWIKKLILTPQAALAPQVTSYSWSVNSEHPPLDKVWSGAVWILTRDFTNDLNSRRMGNMLLAAGLTGLLYLLVEEKYGHVAGIAASAALMTMPRFFFHSHLAALDVPAAFSVFVTTFVFWKLKDKPGWAWGILLGVVWGLALATKINAIFVPVTLGIWWLIFRRDGKLLLKLVLMGLTAIPVFLAVWPWLYTDTYNRVLHYLGFVTTDHWQIGQYYLGSFYMPPPWHFGFVMLWAVIPLSLTILYFTGLIQSGTGKKDNALAWLLFISALVPVLALASGKTMVYDDDRLLMVSYPFLAGLAGIGFGWVFSKWKVLAAKWHPALGTAGGVLLVLLAFGSQLVTMVQLYPHYLSYYSEGVGGVAGANRLGLETTYWCETYQLALPILNKEAKLNDRVWVDPWSQDVLHYYQSQGMLRKDLVILTPNDYVSSSVQISNGKIGHGYPPAIANWFLVEHRQTTLGNDLKNSSLLLMLQKQKKVYEYSFDGVPIFTLYQ